MKNNLVMENLLCSTIVSSVLGMTLLCSAQANTNPFIGQSWKMTSMSCGTSHENIMKDPSSDKDFTSLVCDGKGGCSFSWEGHQKQLQFTFLVDADSKNSSANFKMVSIKIDGRNFDNGSGFDFQSFPQLKDILGSLPPVDIFFEIFKQGFQTGDKYDVYKSYPFLYKLEEKDLVLTSQIQNDPMFCHGEGALKVVLTPSDQ